MIHILLHTLESMVAEKVFGFENNLTEITDIACTQPCMFSFKMQTHVVRFVGQMLTQPAAKLPILRAICVQFHQVCTHRDQSQNLKVKLYCHPLSFPHIIWFPKRWLLKVWNYEGCIFTCLDFSIAQTCYHRQVYAVVKGVGSS